MTRAARSLDELGIEPGPELRERHEAILRQDPALLPRGRTPRTPRPRARDYRCSPARQPCCCWPPSRPRRSR